MNCSVCEERIELDEMKQDFLDLEETHLLKNGNLSGVTLNGRNYCVRCWKLR